MNKIILADLHTHLNEKKVSPKEWWDAVKKKKLSVVAITEHVEYNSKDAYEKLIELKPKGILLIPGMEAKTSAGHVIILGKDPWIYEIKLFQQINAPIEQVLALANEKNLVASFAHPFGYKSDSVCFNLGEKKAKQIIKKYKVGAEYYNGMLGSANGFVFGTQWIKKLYNFFDFVEKSDSGKRLGFAKKSRKIKLKFEKISQETIDRVRKGTIFGQGATYITAGSDAHYPRVIGTAIIQLKKQPRNNEDFIDMIRRRKVLWAGPNIYSKEPVDKLKKKELLEGLKYVTKKKLKKKISKKLKRKRNRNKKRKILIK